MIYDINIYDITPAIFSIHIAKLQGLMIKTRVKEQINSLTYKRTQF